MSKEAAGQTAIWWNEGGEIMYDSESGEDAYDDVYASRSFEVIGVKVARATRRGDERRAIGVSIPREALRDAGLSRDEIFADPPSPKLLAAVGAVAAELRRLPREKLLERKELDLVRVLPLHEVFPGKTLKDFLDSH